MNFTHLFAFYEVARAGSLSGGARRLRVSQPAVSREVKELKGRLGVLLFDRLPRGVSLTYAGKLLFGYADRIFTLAEAARSELKEVAGQSPEHLKNSCERNARCVSRAADDRRIYDALSEGRHRTDCDQYTGGHKRPR
ncbi:LysR family transcriptional regulator [Paraburkholderia youngii]|uniref:LysR family transcriptional regulator n=1 Tax=Paraburkholderia youngii TaxID=2782701 RepID=UPI001C3DD0D6|nr:LysR family transcriptional regulator [Paraburkholderia youngii]